MPGTGNVPALASARRDKWDMAQALTAAGVPRLRQVLTADPAEAEEWLRANDLLGRRLVIKPPKSAAGDEVYVVFEDGDWRERFDRVLGRTNKMGLINDAVLIQEYAEGTEYLVDSYSVDGEHSLVDVCRYTKVGRGDKIGIYRRIDFLAEDDPEVQALWPYTRDVLDAVGIRVGCGHVEVMMTADGPRLIEVAARPAGGGHQMVSELATGDNHIKRTVAHRVRGEVRDGFDLVQHLRGVFIIAPSEGYFRNREVFDGIESLKSFHWMKILHEPDAVVPATVDLFTCLAWVILIHSDAQTLDDDYAPRAGDGGRHRHRDPLSALRVRADHQPPGPSATIVECSLRAARAVSPPPTPTAAAPSTKAVVPLQPPSNSCAPATPPS